MLAIVEPHYFSSIQLASLPKDVLYSNRKDIKYVVSVAEAKELINYLSNDYLLLMDGDSNSFAYQTVYYDTQLFDQYLAHHRGMANREKMRQRTYPDGQSFWEIKKKNNKGQTIKSRTNSMPEPMKGLLPQMEVSYQRVTLYAPGLEEKLTFDFGLSFQREGSTFNLEDLVVVESKGVGHARSPFNLQMRQKRIHSTSFSKYCFGMAKLVTSLKSNNFKNTFRKVENLKYRNAIHTNNQ
jgi:hypothetical protein